MLKAAIFDDDCIVLKEGLMFHMQNGNKIEFLQQLESFIKQLEIGRMSRDVVEHEVLHIFYLALDMIKEMSRDLDKIGKIDCLPHMEIREINTRAEIFEWLRSKMELMMDWVLEVRPTVRHEAVKHACAYIKKYYNRNLTLKEVSEHVRMNATYLSLLFKEEMGQSYIKYLTQLRIERAKYLLREGYKIIDVSESVGYSSYRHFSELFKEHVGMRPGKYKESF